VTDIFRHFLLAHYEAEGYANEATLMLLQDGQVPEELSVLSRADFRLDTKTGEHDEYYCIFSKKYTYVQDMDRPYQGVGLVTGLA
jgi:hypothetical protein